jgi:hypothetical protein
VVIVKHGAMKWEWRVFNRKGTVLMSGWEPTRPVAKQRPLFATSRIACKIGNFFHHQFGVLDDGQPEFDGKEVEFDGYMLIGTFRGKPQSLSGSL